MISVTDLSMTYGGQTLFQKVDLRLDPGKRYGIVGANGAGKSTLLRMLAGQEIPNGGDISRAKRMRLGVLERLRDGPLTAAQLLPAEASAPAPAAT